MLKCMVALFAILQIYSAYNYDKISKLGDIRLYFLIVAAINLFFFIRLFSVPQKIYPFITMFYSFFIGSAIFKMKFDLIFALNCLTVLLAVALQNNYLRTAKQKTAKP